ncbi:hypothetical protein PZ895_07760 [Mesorhizobium sp. YIM 152430]|uniref:hypothetical protein n=1 Tax=Mesorhizobium sp. YIM 152430 TaxID=3031761 RepID=UPI0023DA942D|nr:hypothetical protein [Mesorhizobium sp. YIM 152430]MDF1599670.1 hypothetical protein [Mesorhizobium sp. YIM 152430]
MTPIEQAREALKPCPFCGSDNVSLSAFDAACLSCGAAHPHGGEAWNRRASPSLPVDGVGAEPVVWRYKDEGSGIWHYVEGFEPVRREHRQPLYAAPLASPEAEARLRERVAELEAENIRMAFALKQAPSQRHFDILVEAMAEVKATSDGGSDQPIADIVAGCIAEITALPAEARLAQAEGGPAVTDDAVRRAGDILMQHGLNAPEPVIYQAARAVLEAALRPQSAAGEEGKP